MTPLHIDLVSDVSCPWCAIGLASLEQALGRLAPDVTAEVRCQPFELNPHMAAEGEDIAEHIAAKYGSTPEQFAQSQDHLRARGQAAGFTFSFAPGRRIYNTFDAHRLLHWAGEEGAPGSQLALKHALFDAYFTRNQSPGDQAVLLQCAADCGLDVQRATEVLTTDAFAAAVREREAHWQGLGIQSVPAFIVEGRWLISGGQPAEVFEQALRQIAGELQAGANAPAHQETGAGAPVQGA